MYFQDETIMFMARIYSVAGRLLYQSRAAHPSREEAARMALAQRSKAKGVTTSRAAMVGGEWRDLHSDMRYRPAPRDRAGGGIVKTVALYLRISTEEQTVENQRRELLAVCERRGWHVVAEFCDNGMSGAKGAASGRGSLACIGRSPAASSTLWRRGALTGWAARCRTL
jgi:hypothetical protein